MDNQQRIIWKRQKELFPNESIYETMLVPIYEFGDLAKAIFYMKKRIDRKASIAEAKKAIGDMIVQLKLICSELDIDFEEAENIGFWAFMEHYAELEKKLKENSNKSN